MRSKFFFAFLSLCVYCPMTYAYNWTDWIDCIGFGSSKPTPCELDPGTYDVSTPIIIGRYESNNPNFTIQGTVGNQNAVTLRRAAGTGNSVNPIIGFNTPANVTLQWMTIDGNRQNTQNCAFPNNGGGPNMGEYDVNFSGSQTKQVLYVNFVNAPDVALLLDGSASMAAYNWFGQQGPSSATRGTGILLNGMQSQAWYNEVSYVGTAGISVKGFDQIVYGNTLISNRYEMADGIPGGQLYVGVGVNYATLAQNTINGVYWYTYGQTVNGCSTFSSMFPNMVPYGIEAGDTEAMGMGLRLYNNEVANNMGYGVLLRNLSDVILSGKNIYTPSYADQFVEYNGACVNISGGCYVTDFGPQMEMAGINLNASMHNVTMEHPRVNNNESNGMFLYGVTGGPGFTPPGLPDACIQNNYGNQLVATAGTAAVYSTFTLSCP